MTTPETTQSLSSPPRRWFGAKRVAAAALIAIAGGAALSAFAMDHRHGGPGMMGGGPGMGMMAGRGLDRMLDGVNATEQQRTQIQQIMQSAMADLRAQREQHRALMDRAMAVYTAPTVDANAAEQVRQQMLAQHDATSKRMTAAMIEASRVLTPEQRTKLAERMKERRARMQERMEHGAPPASK
jgi:Spy/CpxP family protein refolding chaperone